MEKVYKGLIRHVSKSISKDEIDQEIKNWIQFNLNLAKPLFRIEEVETGASEERNILVNIYNINTKVEDQENILIGSEIFTLNKVNNTENNKIESHLNTSTKATKYSDVDIFDSKQVKDNLKQVIKENEQEELRNSDLKKFDSITENPKINKSQNNSILTRETKLNQQDDPSDLNEVQIKNPKDKQVEVYFGSITDEQLRVDAIVNSVDRNLDLESGAISKSILSKAGYSIQRELQKNYSNGIQEGQIAVTSGGNLKYAKKIFYVSLDGWDKQKEDELKKKYTQTIGLVLKQADLSHISTLAIPALGSGVLSYPKFLIPNLMFKGINDYLNLRAQSNIKKVFIVVFDRDTELVKEFEKYSNKQVKNQNLENRTISTLNEIKDYTIEKENVKIRVYVGDITLAKTNLIINPTDSSLRTGGAVCRSLIKKDPMIEYELAHLKNKFKNLCLTCAGNALNCKYILHVDTSSPGFDCVFDTLNEINENLFESITFPVIGTGILSGDPKKCSRNMVQSIYSFLDQKDTRINLKNIEICIYHGQRDYFDIFLKELNQDCESKGPIKKKLQGYLKSFMDGINYLI